MINSVAVTGLGRFGLVMARELQASGVDVLTIDKDAEAAQHAAGSLRHAVRADITNREILEQLAVGNFNAAVAAIGRDLTASILTAPTLLPLGGLEVRAKAVDPRQGKILGQMGIVHMFYPETEIGRRAAHLVVQSFADYTDLDHGFALVITTPDPKYCRATSGELGVRRRKGFSVVATRGEGDKWSIAYADIVPYEDDLIIVVAPVKTITRITWGRK